ncbi:substrate-binding domain-containing protein [Lichenicoccus sp.]|uniref:substrate-binding domain-containing protein n=1 Tax=Lichenicoccus sp. TaxID=2781899 RepID=UPI003D10A876
MKRIGLTAGAMMVAALGGIGAFAASTTSHAAPAKTYTFAMITHGQPGDTFWDIVRKGGEAAARNDRVKLIYLANPTASGEAQLVTNVLQQHVDGIALTLAFPDAEIPMVAKATSAGIPVIGFNAGSDDWKRAKMTMFVGQNETIAGEAVGNRLNSEGAKAAICVDQQQGAVQLAERCQGIQKTFHGKLDILYVAGYDMASAQSRIVAKLQQDRSIGYVVTLGAPFAPTAVSAVAAANSKAKVATFDLTPRAVTMIKQGKIQWAVDQQPYAEGYLAIDLLWLNRANGDVIGGGKAVLTGPAFITKDNIDVVAAFAKAGMR